MTFALIPQDKGLQYAIFISPDIKQKITTSWITAKLKILVTAAAVYFPKWIAETKLATSIKNRTAILPFIAET
jgi:hypothetical protein